ncbi:hypothetical protein SAMN04487941_1135 [Pontibacter akesuensis]|uniref:Calcineurin-like phosphoesterase domain-containing protein n=2 Tax=Pontibacter akesuensis TaxID=388950 RepID=A0A1I7GMM4_9BACT|nr:metallophosphatase [Pontibacter akesuensis]SFU49698.1 hypothetical protein SAMN04487941_1135 [Pontibacter akesuensis]
MNKKYGKLLLGSLAVGAAAVLVDALLLEKYFFDVKTFNIGENGGGKQLKLVLLTDLHFKQHLLPHHRKLAAKINELEPDLILITGDTLDSSGTLHPMDAFLSLLHQRIPKAAIPGNNDYKAAPDLSSLKNIYKKHNCDFLVNESKLYLLRGERLLVTGLDDFIEGESDVAAAVADVGHEKHHLLLVHSPLQQETAMKKIRMINRGRSRDEQLQIRYIFAGHNHGGQVRLPGYVPKLPLKSGGYVNGWYNQQPPYLYVSKGFGTSTLPFRFFARSEVTVFKYSM